MMIEQLLKRPLINPALTRPDWRTGSYRPSDLLWLDKNENLDPVLLEFNSNLLRNLDCSALATYPELAPLYLKLADYLHISPDRLLITAGSDGAIRTVFEAFIGNGDKVLHTAPTFAMYFVYSKIYGANEILWNYIPSDNGPDIRFEEFLKTIEVNRPKLVCLPNPDSPTGTVLTSEQMSRLIKLTGDLNCVLLIDEAYHPFFRESVVTVDAPHLLVARTFAKAWGLAGLRIGYLVGSPNLMPYLHKIRPMYEVNTLAVAMMEKVIDHAEEMEKSVKRLNEGKNYFLSSMEKLGYKTLRGFGNFGHVAFGADQSAVFERLKSKALFRLDFAEPCLRGFSRISSTTREVFEPLVRDIASIEREKCKSL